MTKSTVNPQTPQVTYRLHNPLLQTHRGNTTARRSLISSGKKIYNQRVPTAVCSCSRCLSGISTSESFLGVYGQLRSHISHSGKSGSNTLYNLSALTSPNLHPPGLPAPHITIQSDLGHVKISHQPQASLHTVQKKFQIWNNIWTQPSGFHTVQHIILQHGDPLYPRQTPKDGVTGSHPKSVDNTCHNGSFAV